MGDEINFSQYAGRRVIVQKKLDEPNDQGHTLEELEGTAEAANNLGILLKPKGKTQVVLIEAKDIESVDFAPEPTKALKAKELRPVEYGSTRSHLADRHGIVLDTLNADDYTEQKALEFHDGIDHAQPQLGHVHKAESEKKDAKDSVESETPDQPTLLEEAAVHEPGPSGDAEADSPALAGV